MADFIDLAALRDVAGMPLFCLGDHGGMPGLHRALEQGGIPWRSLFAGSTEEKALDVAPLLFRVDDAIASGRRALLRWVAEHGTYTSSMILLASPLDIDELARRLARRLDAVIDDDVDVMLRFFDPRVFEALNDALSGPGRAAWLGVASGWWYLDRRGVAVACRCGFRAVDDFVAPLRLDAAQQRALVAASEPDQVAGRLASVAPDAWLSMPLPRRHGFVLEAMAAGRALGLASLHDLTLYCVVALLEGTGFARTPKWRDAIEAVGAGRATLAEAIGVAEAGR